MFPLFRIALRNLAQHRGKTIIVGTIIALGVTVLIVGNSLMETARLGIERAFIDNYTGHVMVSGLSRGDISLFGVQSVGGVEETPVLPRVDDIRDFARGMDEVVASTAQLTSFGRIGVDEVDGRTFGLLFGINPESYFTMFDRVRIVDGRRLEPGERGIMLSVQRAEALVRAIRRDAEDDEREPEVTEAAVGMPIALSSIGSGGFRIRVVPLVGVYEPISGEAVGSEFISFVDAPTLRALTGLNVGVASDVELTADETELLSADDFDALFSDVDGAGAVDTDGGLGDAGDPAGDVDWDNLFGDLEAAEAGDDAVADQAAGQPAGQDPGVATGDSSADTVGAGAESDRAADGGPWNFLLLRLTRLSDTERVVDSLNAYFAEQGIGAEAWGWEQAAGPFATTADVVRIVFNVAIIIVGFVAAIIIMNTLVISVIERTGEIGTMRALGAPRFFVWRLFFTESLVITGVFGLIGIGVGSAVVGILHVVGIPATTTFLEVLFAGPELKPVVSAVTLAGSVAIVAAIALLSHIYPVSVALKVQPVRAMRTE